MSLFIGAIESNLSRMFGDVNERVGTIAVAIGQTPQGWNANIFNLIQNIAQTVIMPIAGIIITYVLCVELITMVTDKNSFSDNVDTFMFFKFVFKAWVAVLIVTHTFDITMAVFDVAQHVIAGAAGVIGGNTAIDIDAAIAAMDLDSYSIPELMLLMVQSFIVSFALQIMSVIITVIIYARMIEIYLTCSVAPIPLATMANKEWGTMGQNYLRNLFALGFQGFFLMLCVGIYAVLINEMIVSTSIHTAMFSAMAYTILLCFAMMKSGTLAKSIFGAS
jgi:uncharacterized protein with PQ loop repeat